MNDSPTTSRLAILLWATSAQDPARCATPFVHAAAAAAMDCEVEMHFTAKSVRLLESGVARELYPNRSREKSVYDFMREAADLGVKFWACSMSAREHLDTNAPLIPEMTGMAGAAAFMQRVMDPNWRTAVY
jgi:uncharacterized protein